MTSITTCSCLSTSVSEIQYVKYQLWQNTAAQLESLEGANIPESLLLLLISDHMAFVLSGLFSVEFFLGY